MGCFSSKPAGVRVPPAIATPRCARAAAPSPFQRAISDSICARMCAFAARPTDLADPPPAIQQGKRPGNPVGGKAQPNSKGKFTRAGSVLGRSTEDVNDHYHFHEVGART
jgi:hypothetical protein